MASFRKNQSLQDLQGIIGQIYNLPNDRDYSLPDLLTQQQRFSMRALKGIRKGDSRKIQNNLLISISWLMSIANRLHIDVENEVWQRFPGVCSYCGQSPCVCKSRKVNSRRKIIKKSGNKPASLRQVQQMFGEIYPANQRSLIEAGVHLAEEMGEVSEAVHNFMGLHKESNFKEISAEIADYMSCIFGVANSADIDLAGKLAERFSYGCHVCKHTPCSCSYKFVSQYTS